MKVSDIKLGSKVSSSHWGDRTFTVIGIRYTDGPDGKHVEIDAEGERRSTAQVNFIPEPEKHKFRFKPVYGFYLVLLTMIAVAAVYDFAWQAGFVWIVALLATPMFFSNTWSQYWNKIKGPARSNDND